MNLMLELPVKKLPVHISYDQHLMLIGSCFTEHIGNSLSELKFNVLQNPNGIIYDPISICQNLVSYIQQKTFEEKDIFERNGLWQSWQHHSRFSGTNKQNVLDLINDHQLAAHNFLQNADWLILTFGTAFSYRLLDDKTGHTVQSVANCHKAPSGWFQKNLLSITEMVTAIDNCMHQLFHFNPKLKILFTVSPVRHVKDGIIENNQSKARLIETVHHMVNKFDKLFYFPAYELVIDVLRDYRFYDEDLVHPNRQATQFVFDHFVNTCMDNQSIDLLKQVAAIVNARNHRPFQPGTLAHQQFLQSFFEKAHTLQSRHPYLNLQPELDYFSTNSDNL